MMTRTGAIAEGISPIGEPGGFDEFYRREVRAVVGLAYARHQGPVKVELGGAPPSAPTGGPPRASAVPPPPATTTPAGGYAARWVGRRFVPRPGTEPVPGVSLAPHPKMLRWRAISL